MSDTPTEDPHAPTFRTLDMNAAVRRAWGAGWGKPELEYEWSSGRKHYRRTEDSGIYKPQDE